MDGPQSMVSSAACFCTI